MAFRGISLQPLWAGVLFFLALLTVPLAYFPGMVLLPIILLAASGAAAFWNPEHRRGWLAYGFAGVLASLLLAGLALFGHDLQLDDYRDCDRLIKATLSRPESYERISVSDEIFTDDPRGAMDATFEFGFVDRRGVRRTAVMYCHSAYDKYAAGVWPARS